MALLHFSVNGFTAADRAQLNRIERMLGRILDLENNEHMTLSELKTQVEQNVTVEKSAVDLINGVAAQLAAAKDDPAAVQALADELQQSASTLASAVAANTAEPPAPGPAV